MKAILTDVTKCIGCEKCISACNKVNNLGPDTPRYQHNRDGLSSTRWTAIIRRPGRDNSASRFIRGHCRHCIDPACVSACLVGGMQKSKDVDGPVIYDKSRCMGCRYCMMVCPYGIPRYSWEDVVPSIKKCNFCADRLKQGHQPGCTEACPTAATIFGERDKLLEEAWRRIKAGPGKYMEKVYGEKEIGGTCVLYLSDVPLDFLSWKPDLGERPLPDLSWAALRKVPYECAAVAGIATGLYWLLERKNKVAKSEGGNDE